uniref:GST N-terminal domain-containing protein n=1 Tax=Spermophilus dauricus TaxID=99837 RepID=A0A8C9Q551_SPEDA
MPMILGYWNIRGLAHPIRLLLEYTDSSYEEKKYTMGDGNGTPRVRWLNEKFKLGLDFPNVGRQKRRRFVWTFWRTRLWTSTSWSHF